jgi:hypothetical protein
MSQATHAVERQPKCTWIDQEGEYYVTDCDNTFVFLVGSIKESDFLYCPYCGRTIREVIPAGVWSAWR